MINREIKFRAWVPSESEMYYTGFYIHQLTGKCFYEYDGDFKCDYKDQLTPPMYDCGEEEPILMQYTGLKDKNGREIYEGDIVKGYSVYAEADQYKEVVFSPHKGWYLKPEIGITIGGRIEVIGNIYEHEHLLK